MFKMKSILKDIKSNLEQNGGCWRKIDNVITIYRLPSQKKIRWCNIDYKGVKTWIEPLVRMEKINEKWIVTDANLEGFRKLQDEKIEHNNPFDQE